MTERHRNILIVEDSSTWRELLPELFDKIKTRVVGSAKEVPQALSKGDITEIITDGLGGKWTEVVKHAGNLPVKLLSGDLRHKSLSTEKGVPFFDKGDFDLDELLE